MQNESVKQAVQAVLSRGDLKAETALVLGSGLGNFVETLEDRTHILFAEIPNFPQSTVAGHSGELVHGYLDGIAVWVNSGRVHFYEGYTLEQVVFPIEVLVALGARTLILTNAAGSLRNDYRPGDLMLINKVLNLTGHSVYQNETEPDALFNPKHLAKVQELSQKHDLDLKLGIYAGLNGPSYETPAEIRFLRLKGADAVGMSTVHEAMRAAQLGLDVLGISCLTNYASGILDQPLNHEEVMETGRRVRTKFASLLEQIVKRI